MDELLMPRPRVCAVCLHNPCECPDLVEMDDQEPQEDLDMIETFQRALDAAEAV